MITALVIIGLLIVGIIGYWQIKSRIDMWKDRERRGP